MSHGHYHTSAAWAPPQHPRRPAAAVPWRFVVLVGALAIGVDDTGVRLLRISNDLVAALDGAQISPRGARVRATQTARAAAGRRLVAEIAASWGIE